MSVPDGVPESGSAATPAAAPTTAPAPVPPPAPASTTPPADGTAGAGTGAVPVNQEVKPYRIHVSSKYLDLTKQKLELTRLPHEGSEARSREWWEPKAQVEPLIDFWLEQYSWRDQENAFNTSLPQFRTALSIPTSPASSVRIQFIHARSAHASAIPLLLIPPFPFTNLSIGHLVKPLTEPDDPANDQPFHVVIPSLPGLGFSDGLPNNSDMVPAAAGLFDALMRRLAYPVYLASNTGSGTSAPGRVDWKVARCLAEKYAESCTGVHLISPPFSAPRAKEALAEWTKWSVARVLRKPVLGYSQEDITAFGRSKAQSSPPKGGKGKKSRATERKDTASIEPNSLAYALCDSPTGLLVLVLKLLHILGPAHEFTSAEILTLTELAWLPGPEGALRFWAHCASQDGDEDTARVKTKGSKPRVGITVFLGEEEKPREGDGANPTIVPNPAMSSYVCPQWAKARFDVVHANRVSGKPGLLAWERPEVITIGIRALAKAVLPLDERLRPAVVSDATVVEQLVTPAQSPDASPPPAGTSTPPAATGGNGASQAVSNEAPATTAPESTMAPLAKLPTALLESVPEHVGREGSAATASERGGSDDENEAGGRSPDTVVAVPLSG